ncbi:protein of unknown function DUF1236 [Methylobacterium aquaticum]|uniref:Uncharacterized protein n=1 Tax=Methylobacterium aquaticum TaxID=270351 RepID=A0A0C6FD88_9HYPH|nr:protein of unknown function DUF1236 [Methylobacterium aquaticum]
MPAWAKAASTLAIASLRLGTAWSHFALPDRIAAGLAGSVTSSTSDGSPGLATRGGRLALDGAGAAGGTAGVPGGSAFSGAGGVGAWFAPGPGPGAVVVGSGVVWAGEGVAAGGAAVDGTGAGAGAWARTEAPQARDAARPIAIVGRRVFITGGTLRSLA